MRELNELILNKNPLGVTLEGFFRIIHIPKHKAMTKKAFKEKCDTSHTYKGDRSRTNAIYFGWQDTPEGRGFKSAVAMDTRNGTKAELLEVLYQWMVNEVEPPYYVRYKYAENDSKRFKCPICLNF